MKVVVNDHWLNKHDSKGVFLDANTKIRKNLKIKKLIWITNGVNNKRINPEETIVPENWRKGRVYTRIISEKHRIAASKVGKNNKGKKLGKYNPASKPLLFSNIYYCSIREASKETGLSAYKLRKYII